MRLLSLFPPGESYDTGRKGLISLSHEDRTSLSQIPEAASIPSSEKIRQIFRTSALRFYRF